MRLQVSNGGDHLVQKAMSAVPGRVIIWTMPFKQLYKDPAVMVTQKRKVVRLDALAKKEGADAAEDKSVFSVATTSIEAADQKYAAMWALYVFISDSLYYSGILPKLLRTAGNATEAETHRQKLQKAQAFLLAAFDVVIHDWTLQFSRRPAAERHGFLTSPMNPAHFKPLVAKWVADYRNQQPKDSGEEVHWDATSGLSTVNIDHYVHEWDSADRSPAHNCRERPVQVRCRRYGRLGGRGPGPALRGRSACRLPNDMRRAAGGGAVGDGVP